MPMLGYGARKKHLAVMQICLYPADESQTVGYAVRAMQVLRRRRPVLWGGMPKHPRTRLSTSFKTGLFWSMVVDREAATSRRTPLGLTQRDDQNGRGSSAFQAYRAGGGGRQIGYPAAMERSSVGDSGNDGFVISKIGDAN